MKVLVLGGTAFLGRALAHAAVGRGHDVTCLARGSAPAPEGVTFVRADRDAEDGLAAVADLRWDAVLDVSRQPGQVRRAVRDLHAGHSVFVSTGNVYADFAGIEPSEDAPVRAPLQGDITATMEMYGEAKVACEDAIRASGTTYTIVRSGLIGGRGDSSGRTGYWPWRFAHPVGDEVIVPDDPDFPCALIDVRDLVGWLLDAAENQLDGTFNATGPTVPLSHVLEAAATVAGTTARPRAVPPPLLRELGVRAWMGPTSLPLWIDDPDWRGFATLNTDRARRAGLRTRPLEETLRAALEYEEHRDIPRQAGLTDDEERALLDRLDALPGAASTGHATP